MNCFCIGVTIPEICLRGQYSRIDGWSEVRSLTCVIFFINEPFHECIINGKKFFRSLVLFGVGWVIAQELVAAEAHSSHLKKQAAILLIIDRIKTCKHFLGISICIEFTRLRVISFGVFACNDIFLTVFDGTTLSNKKVHFMQQVWNAVHFNYVLNILFFA